MWRKIIIFNYNSQWTKKHDVNWRLLTQKWYISLWYVVIHLIIDKKHTKKKTLIIRFNILKNIQFKNYLVKKI